MDCFNKYKLFLLDFDGLLVNTEDLHYQAYQLLIENHGYTLSWDFERYCKAAHYSSTALRDNIYADFPVLKEQYPEWDILYREKKKNYAELVEGGAVKLMPGAEEFLKYLSGIKAKHCVVTHSPLEHIELIRHQCPQLDSIPRWFTREDYTKAKPSPDCCFKAMDYFGVDAEHTVGFDDTPRGVQALLNAKVQPFWLTAINYPDADVYLEQGVKLYRGLSDIVQKFSSRL